MVLNGKHVAIELRQPLAPLYCLFEMALSIAYVGFNLSPEEAGILFSQVRRSGIAKFFIHAGLDELVEERIDLARKQWIGELTNKIGGT